MAAGVHVPLRFLRVAMKKGLASLKFRFSSPQQTIKTLEPIYSKLPRNHSLHIASRQKIGGRWYSKSIKNIFRITNNTAPNALKGPSVRGTLVRTTTTSPFASTLRPCLTGGAFPRTASGYSIGGGARFFSHSPSAPAQVIQQVTNGVRAFFHSGKGQLDSYRRNDGTLGGISVRAQLAASLAQQNAPGAYVDFDLSPMMTCLSTINFARNSLGNPDFMDSLSADFGAMVGSIVAINADIKRLGTLGDLPISLATSNILRVHFRGCDKDFVERLCDEVDVRRGIVHEDERFMHGMLASAVGWKEMLSESNSPLLSSTYSEDRFESDIKFSSDHDSESICSKISGSESVGENYYFESAGRSVLIDSPGSHGISPDTYDGIEGIHRFLAECDDYRAGLST